VEERDKMSLIKGIGLVVIFWIVNTFIAFSIFNRDTKVQFVIMSWIIADILIFNFLKKLKFADTKSNITAMFTLAVLIMLYLAPINSNFPQEALDLNEQISRESSDKYNYAKELFYITGDKWTGPTREYLLQPDVVFLRKDATFFWNVEGYVPSNIQAQMYRNLLLESGRFTEEEIEFKQQFCTNSPHGYNLFILDSDQVFYSDHWAVDHFEEYEFGQVTFAPCDELTGEGR
jgi:hypothetical protein